MKKTALWKKQSKSPGLPSSGQSMEFEEFDEEDIWVDCLSTLNSDITSGVISYLLRQSLTEEEREKNSQMILGFFKQIDKLPEFINFCIERDYFIKLDAPTIYSPFTSIIVSIVNICDQELFLELQQALIKKCGKLKGIELDEEKKSSSEKTLKKLKELLVYFVESWMNYKNFSPLVIDIWSQTQELLISKGVDQTTIDKTMTRIIFLSPFNSFVSCWKSQVETVDAVILLSKLLQSLLSPIPTQSYWKNWMKDNCKDLLEKMTKFMRSKKGITIQRRNFDLNVVPNGSLLIESLNKDWKELKDYISPEGFHLVEIHMQEQTELKVKALLIIRELNNLRVTTFNENQMYLQKMSQMKMRIKDLYEERRYLKQLLGEDDDDEKQ
ncbi:hypothetical protein KM1_182430 [Entamoeba histolytica HM-3:IMSS]|uniref:Uncharacterized protein n=6 Tax=Entamoeba histolytica TaxID=5759 RepID=C4MB80_ENTH1|nr:hypothetical protein EHI_028540 [Entamoeba histolytica HM-1:IMSS]EMD42966.1 Hypothetical protein EHI5A_139250 [Entamoeba histolytica KU27]EMS15134.1 hypothetical protein KM1_182430 [Entamoeba histolytica HM-3:IMSS]ENY65090.1 hypothetical protein EHI7A_105640 [Entamoeba histolytica HM-1:IMSS-A]GAT99191.1 hypothetical protein CL6EHI_028540 [Entamoeba histolytica]EAL49544.2 hypothetical protein EHI_028540 [Entamoeba histolytica HM-1:IMSS]|eukprot:XP_654930.2 hypothetical protein EHI_028540 [Entamoeba histolytica HM-1:IMSS]